MGCMFRSDEMTCVQMYLQREAAFDVIQQLGEMGCTQFEDMNPDVQPFQRNHINEVCRCAEMERKLRVIEAEMMKDTIPMPLCEMEPRALPPEVLLPMENLLEKWEEDITEMSDNHTAIAKNYYELTEMQYVLSNLEQLMGDAEIQQAFSKKGGGGGGDYGRDGKLIFVTGAVMRSKSYAFEIMLWRLSRGNIYIRMANDDKLLTDPTSGQQLRKVAFLLICQGEELHQRVLKVCNGFHVITYPCPISTEERTIILDKLSTRLVDMEQVLKKTRYYRCRALLNVGKKFDEWMIQIRKAKAVYHVLNKFSIDITSQCLIGRCWMPNDDVPRVNKVLEEVSAQRKTNVPCFMTKIDSSGVTPTFHRTNRFTHAFQVLINAYGDSSYRELNPGLYTIITFPFLFAIMFGDFGHGLIMCVFSSWMVIKEKKLIEAKSTNEIWNIFFGGRYVILLMSFFSLYTGFIYNDYFSKPIVLKQPYWMNQMTAVELSKRDFFEIDPAKETHIPYPFGVDPTWALSKNKIMHDNSLKMKFSIIIGIIHMMFGLVLSLFNHLHFKRYYAVILEFIPQMIFLTGLFFWLVILIYFKWFNYAGKYTPYDQVHGSACAPLILILFIDMVLMSTSKPVDEGCEAYMFPHQQVIQTTIVFCALLCVPIILLGSPVYLHNRSKRRKKLFNKKNAKRGKNEADEAELALLKKEIEHDHTFGELMIHQGVHTIEFVLSTISHTASYLRLWALSLAHAQLSEMLWGMILSKLALQDHSIFGAFKLVAIFAVWAAFSLSILVLMEGLSAFLHTLRLHWVEFMSKFYTGGGRPFAPFSFRSILSSDGVEKSEGVCKKKARKKET